MAQPSSLARTHACLDAIARHDDTLRAFITVCRQAALGKASAADRAAAQGKSLGLLHGMPVALKDCIDVAALRCTVGSAFFAERVATTDAPVVRRLRAAGAVFVGKTNLHEFCFGGTSQNEHFGRVRNPWDATRIPGGSSGGSAVAAAAGMCEGAIGTDTGASVRLPAALCGVVGLRPTAGAVSNEGVFPVSPPYDTVGAMARTVADVARLFAAMADAGGADVLTGLDGGVAGLRILVPTTFFFDEADGAVASLVLAAARQLEKLGAVLVRRALPGADAAQPHLNPIIYADAAALHFERLRDEPERFGAQVRARLQPGLAMTAVEYARCLRWLERWRDQVATLFADGIDLVLTPTVGTTAPPIPPDDEVIGATANVTRLCWAWPAAQVPALTVPCGFVGGLPVGTQLAAARGNEALLLRAGQAYQAATGWHAARPPLA